MPSLSGSPNAIRRASLAVVAPSLPRLTQVKAPVAAGSFVTIPAPAVGFIRVLHRTALTSLGSTPNYNVTLEPTGLYIFGRATTGGAATGSSVGVPGGARFAFGADETVKVANGGSADATLVYWYSDISATNRTLVRKQFANVGNAAVELIPVAASGYYNQFVSTANKTSLSGFWALNCLATVFNDDTAAVVADFLLGPTVVGRNGSQAAASSAFSVAYDANWVITDTALNVKAQAAATDATRRPIVFACYETLPL